MNAVISILDNKSFRPFLSVMLIVLTLLGIVFLQMEERRLGYTLLKLTHEHRDILDEKRQREIQLAKITRPQLLEHMAQSRFTLKKVSAKQIIHLPGTDNSKAVKTAVRGAGGEAGTL